MKNRLKQIRAVLGLQQGEMADKIEVHQQQLSKYERGENKPSSEFLIKLGEKLNINLNWLLTGAGNMFLTDNDFIIKDFTGIKLLTNDNLDDLVSIHYIEIPGIDNSIIKSPYVKQQLRYDREMVENVWQRKSENQRIVKMRGDKMNHGDYPLANNDILMIDISEINIANSGIYIYTTDLEQGREVYISNVNKRPNGDVRMSYLNPKYEEIIYTPEQLQEINFTVWGRVVKNLSLTI